jgi:hypothetical protein
MTKKMLVDMALIMLSDGPSHTSEQVTDVVERIGEAFDADRDTQYAAFTELCERIEIE